MVKFKTRKRRPNNSLDWTIRRIAQICCGSEITDRRISNTVGPKEFDPNIYQKDSGSYVLAAGGNDWFLAPDDRAVGEGIQYSKESVEDDDFYYWTLDYRYTTPERQKALEGLALFLEWTLGDT